MLPQPLPILRGWWTPPTGRSLGARFATPAPTDPLDGLVELPGPGLGPRHGLGPLGLMAIGVVFEQEPVIGRLGIRQGGAGMQAEHLVGIRHGR